MQVFEFHFNPPRRNKYGAGQTKTKNDLIFESFCYEPENIYEKRAGNLYMTGLLKNILPNNIKFLDNLAEVIKNKYYKTTIFSSEKSLRESLKKANEYLETIAKKGDVRWLGNLSFSVLSIAFRQKGYEFNFTKVGDMKIFLLRNGHLIDIDQKLKFEDIEPYPLKIFGNIISGKLLENDVILVLTKEVLELFQNKNFLYDLAKLQFSGQFDFKKLKDFLNEKKEELLKICGVFLAIVLDKEIHLKEKEKMLPPKTLQFFSLTKLNYLANFHLPENFLKILIPVPKIIKIDIAALKSKSIFQNSLFTKNLFLVLGFLVFLIFGFLVFQQKEKQKISQYQTELNRIKQKTDEAESYLLLAKNNPRSQKQANILLKESLEDISLFVNIAYSLPQGLVTEIKSLEEKISKELYELNKLKIVAEPTLVFEFSSREFVPQKIIYFKNKIYFLNPFAENIFELDAESKGNILSLNKKFGFAAQLNNSIIFLLKSGEFFNFENGRFSESLNLKNPYPERSERQGSPQGGDSYPEFHLTDIASYYSNLYVLDNKNKTLIKYPYVNGLNWSAPQIWLKNESVANIKSIAVDGSVWALTTDDNIQRYYGQRLQENLKLDIFPTPKNFSKIFTSNQLPYLYLLDPGQKRIVVLNKSGGIENQFQSQKFDNLLDFAVSENGKTIYLLNGLKVYKIEL